METVAKGVYKVQNVVVGKTDPLGNRKVRFGTFKMMLVGKMMSSIL